MGPDELDDLLSSIRAEGKRESALALYEGVGEEDLVDENIDERVLKILGLNDVFDIDYGTYITLLKERLTASRSFEKKLSTEEDQLLVSEFKRVKGNVGRFKIKRKKITADSLGVTGPIQISKEKFYLTTKAVIPDSEDNNDLKDISEKLDELIKSIIEQGKEEKKREEKERKEREDKKRRAREGALEAVTKPAKEIIKKLVAPFQSIFDRIMRFVQFTLLGFFLNNFLKWFADPKNQKKIKVLGRFLKDWWPTLLGAAALFFTPFGKFVRGVVGLLKLFGPALLRLAAKNKVASTITATTLLAVLKETQIEKQREILAGITPQETKETGKAPSVTQLKAESVSRTGLGFSKGGLIPKIPNFLNIRDIALNGGSYIDDDTGLRIKGAGPDTQLVAAQPGEVVMSKKAVDYWGANRLLMMNKMGGGTNVPKMVNNIQLAQGGGLIGGGMNPVAGFMDWWNRGRNMRVPNENMARFGGLRQYLKKSPNPSTLFGDDALQITRGNKAFQSGATGYRGWNPFKAFTPNMVKTGPTPAIRQAVERPLRSFSRAPKMIKGAGGGVGSVLMDMLFPEPAFNPTLDDARRMGFPMGPQSRVSPVGTPVISSKTQMIVLPPTTTVAKKPSVPTISGTQIPEFSIVANTNHRSLVSSALGISDLVG